MSREIQIGFPCPHLVMEEVVVLDSDRRSLVTRAPVSNANSVRVLVNDSFYVPPSGLYSQATLQGGPGPYRIEKCVGLAGPDGNSLRVRASRGTVTVSLPLSDRISAVALQSHLKLSGLGDLVDVRVVEGAITFADSHSNGKTSFVQVSGDGADALKFTQRGARGAEIYPGWVLAARQDVYPSTAPRGLIPVAARYPRFKSPVPSAVDFKVTYAAMPERCPRCRATYVENDYRFDMTGEVRTLVNEDLLYQACLKSILTIKGSNPYHTGYGSQVLVRVGRKRLSATATALRQDVIAALGTVSSLQGGQMKFQQVTDKERLYRVEAVDVRPTADDPTAAYVSIVVTNGSNRRVVLNIVYSAPGAVALAGSNGQALGASGMSPQQAQRFLLDG